MQPWNLRTYLGYGLRIISAHTIVLWWIGLLGLLNGAALLLKDSTAFWPLNVLLTILSIASTPVIYGLYYQLIEDTYTSIPAIARTYIPGYLWLIIRMYLPPIFLASMLVTLLAGAIPSFGGGGVLELTLVLFSLIYLFVIPFYYLGGSGRGAVTRGIRFLSRNLAPATPLLLGVLLLESGMLLLQYQRLGFDPARAPFYVVIDFLAYVLASIADYLIFIILIFVLKQHPEEIGPPP